MIRQAGERLRQRADYTHKFNASAGRHGWLRLTPAYSLRIVEELIAPHDRSLRVLDPFCGTGTTALSAAYHGHDAVTTEINPFLVWFGQAKTARYSPHVATRTRQACDAILDVVKREKIEPAAAPPIHKIERWWAPKSLLFLRQLSAAIEHVTPARSRERDLLKIAFCRTLIKLSNAAFNHQSMSFKDSSQAQIDLPIDRAGIFREDVSFLVEGAERNPRGRCRVVNRDARDLANLEEGRFDLVVTSPPYANRMSYIRELRPYMYWLGFLVNGRDAGELDWTSIGGTWGVATSRLTDWKPQRRSYASEELEETLAAIASPDNANGELLATYVRKYFVDMAAHFEQMRSLLAPGARVHYIVGNSTFYGVLLPAERFYADMMRRVGFKNPEVRAVRKRNSKKELVEFDVSAVWEG